MKTSEHIGHLAAALATAQGKFRNPDKNKTAKIPLKAGGFYTYNYADLPIIFDCARDALSENGLSHLSSMVLEEKGPVLSMRLIHSSGEWVESDYPLPGNVDDKGLAASMTYGRRYLFSALTGLAADEDTDSDPEPDATYVPRPSSVKSVSQKIAPKPSAVKPVVPNAAIPEPTPVWRTTSPTTEIPVDDKDRKFFTSTLAGCGWSVREGAEFINAAYKKTLLTELSRNEFNDIITHVQGHIKNKSVLG